VTSLYQIDQTSYSNNREISLNKSSDGTYYNSNYYTNVDNHRVQSPTYYDYQPSGASAVCRDGSYSFSQNRRGTCSRHGGVRKWL
jgi:hypothetical protein